MIFYRNGGTVTFFRNLCQRHGSVFPNAFTVAFPIAVLSGMLRYCYDEGYVNFYRDGKLPLMNESAVWGGFTFLVGFLIVFRTNISYSRFWDGMTSTHKMRAEWFDACAAICAFTKHSEASDSRIEEFQNLLIRLFSLLHNVALAEIEDSSSEDPLRIQGFGLGLLDDHFIDDQSLLAVRDSASKPELVFQWIQQLVVENIRTGVLSVPPPILSRAFQELANGMVEFHEALKVSTIPFPFPYAQICDFLLIAHGMMTPIITTLWVNDAWWAGAFSFLQLLIMWSLRFIAVELENPFGMDANDLDQHLMQEEMNTHLALLVSPCCKRTPMLQKVPPKSTDQNGEGTVIDNEESQRSLKAAWLRASSQFSLADHDHNAAIQATSSPHFEPAESVRCSVRRGARERQEGGKQKLVVIRSKTQRLGDDSRLKSTWVPSEPQVVEFPATDVKSDLFAAASPSSPTASDCAGERPFLEDDVKSSGNPAGMAFTSEPLDVKPVALGSGSESSDHLQLQIPNEDSRTKPAGLRQNALKGHSL